MTDGTDETTECVVCERPLRQHDQACCERCIERARDALTLIRDADLEPAIEGTALHPGDLPGGRALVMAADGNDNNLRPYPTRRLPSDRELDVPHGGLVGQVFCHLPYMEQRRPANGREHYADHWRSDPLVPIAVVESIAREWRHALGYVTADDQIRDVAGWCDWLLVRLRQATGLPSFPDDAGTLRLLAAQLANTTGNVNYPEVAPARCFDCGDQLISPYREPAAPVPPQGRRGYSFEGRDMVETDDGTVLPVWRCANRDCQREYPPGPYWLALKAALIEEAERAG